MLLSVFFFNPIASIHSRPVIRGAQLTSAHGQTAESGA